MLEQVFEYHGGVTQDLSDLDPTGTLVGIEAALRRRRTAEVEQLFLVLRWCDLHGSDPVDDPGGRRPPGADRLGFLGGDGTPGVRELALVELAVALQVHGLSARCLVSDALDLRHRLPRTLQKVADLDAELWIARKVAAMTRDLPFEVMHLIDDAVASAIGSQAPSRVLELAEAKTIEVDQAAHMRRLQQKRRERFVGLSRPDDTGLRTVIARVSTADAHVVHALLEQVAEQLAARPEHAGQGRDELRSVAFGWLARPLDLIRLLAEGEDTPEARSLVETIAALDPAALRPRAVLYLHLHEATLPGASLPEAGGLPGVARVEGLGPMVLEEVTELLGHHHVVLKPVIDLAEQVSVNCYEHPAALGERVHLLRPGDQFPHASSRSRRLDLDHPVPYDPGGPPGQTSSRTAQPLGRTNHRAKTHLGHRATPLRTGEVVWRTRHGLTRIVDPAGTHVIDPAAAEAMCGEDPFEAAVALLMHRARTGQLDTYLEMHRMDTEPGCWQFSPMPEVVLEADLPLQGAADDPDR